MKSFVRYAIAWINHESEELAYRIYVTDALQVITENTARFAGGSYFKTRFIDQLRPKKQPEQKDDRNGQEIADDIIGRLTKKAVKS